MTKGNHPLQTPSPNPRRKWLLRVLGALPFLGFALFVWNGSSRAWQVPDSGTTQLAPSIPGETLRIMAWNLAKCGFHQGGFDFLSTDEVERKLDAIAEVIRREEIDLLFLSEVVIEAFPCPVNQVAYLADKASFSDWCYGDNYSFGLPFARIRSGNAILSRFALNPVSVEQLAGETSLWDPTGQRRVLWADLEFGQETLRVGSIRNDSFDLKNNAVQTREILESLGAQPTLLGGDFNAEPGSEPMELWKRSGRFRGVFQGAPTYPAASPYRRIDTILIPAAWPGAITQTVLDEDLSDHEPVVVEVPTTSLQVKKV